jgi:predicted permease
MQDFIIKIAPVILIFFLGFITKQMRLFKHDDGDILLRIVFHVTLPAMVFRAAHRVELSWQFIWLPFIAMAVIFIIYGLALLTAGKMPMPRPTRGAFLVGSMIMNTGAILPFIIAKYGSYGLAVYTIFDFGNVLLIFTFVYYVAMRHGEGSRGAVNWKKFFKLPPIYGLLAGLLAKALGVSLPPMTASILDGVGAPTAFLVMFALGLYFHPRVQNMGRMAVVFALRMGVGLLLGTAIASLLHLQGSLRALVIVCSGAPVGYNTVVFASMEKLDKDFAASLVSISLIMGMVYVPLLMFLLE